MTDEPLTTCPSCGAQIRRVLFPAGVVFKGSGFYKTDHRDSSNGESSAKDEKKTATDGNKTEAAPTASESTGSKSTESGSSTSSTTTASDSKPAATTGAA